MCLRDRLAQRREETGISYTVIQAEVPLANMFGYATVIRSLSKGMATFTMEMARYSRVPAKIAEEIIEIRRQARNSKT